MSRRMSLKLMRFRLIIRKEFGKKEGPSPAMDIEKGSKKEQFKGGKPRFRIIV